MDQKEKGQPEIVNRHLHRLNLGLGLGFFVVVAASVAILLINAASVSNRKDQMSDQSKSNNAAHQISFNLSGSNSFAVGETIDVAFPAGFSVGGVWAAADFTFTDGTVRTVDAVASGPGITTVACTNAVNNIGVAVDTTARVFRFLPCGGSFGSSATGAFVTLLIDGQAPNGTLTNPGSAGSYVVNITNAAGDCLSAGDICSMGVAVVDAASVMVTATVLSSVACGNSIVELGETCDDGNLINGDGCSSTCQTEGGGGGPGPDVTPPVISGVNAINITSTGARITWNTDEAANSLVRYGTTVAYGSTQSDSAYVTTHNVDLSSLTNGTLYHYQVCSTDSASNQGCSGDNTFTTLDTLPPNISNVQVTAIGPNTATVTWDTDESSTSYVDYGLVAGPPFANTSGAASPMVLNHSVILSGLTASTLYHYRVRSGDAAFNEGFTLDATFSTTAPADTTAPVISNVQVTAITGTGATITWTTNEAATTFVDYDTDGAPYASTAGAASPLVTSHSVTLSGLTSQTLYHYRVRSADAASNEASTSDATFTTADVTAPVISAVTVTNITTTGARITWSTNENSDSKVDYGLTTGYGSTQTNASLVTAHQIDLAGLTPNTLYHFKVTSKDAANNSASSLDQTFTTLLTPPPVISNIQVLAITGTTATITWNTDVNSDSRVNYGLTTGYGLNASGNTNTTSHSVSLSGLTPNQLYHYRVRSTDAYGSEAISSDAVFTTTDTVPPVISNIQVTGITGTGATVTWTTNEAATTFVDYDTDGAPYASTSGVATPRVTSHSVTLSGLTGSTLYHYRVRSADAVANESSSGDATFTTLDSTPPVVSNIQVTGLTATSATVTWDTNEAATSFVDYDTDGAPYASTAGAASPLVTSHSVLVSGLTAETLYHFRVRSADATGNSTASGDNTFTTLDISSPIISNIQVVGISGTGATVTWTTNEAATSFVDYDTDGAPYASTAGVATPRVTSHSVTLSSLTESTTYHYRVRSADVDNNEASSNDATFTTPDLTPPSLSNIQVTGITGTGATVTWTTNEAATTFVDYDTDGAPYASTAGVATPRVTSHSVTLSGLTQGTTYHFRVRSADLSNNEAASGDGTFTTLDLTAPIISNIQVSNITGNSAVVTWTTNEPTGSLVDYGLAAGPPYAGTAGAALPLVTSHSVPLASLSDGTTYHFRVRSADASGNESVSLDAIFSTLDTLPPTITSVTVSAITHNAATVTWTTNEAATTFVDYDTDGAPYASTAGTALPRVTSHTVNLTGLSENTTYHYRVRSADAVPNEATTLDATFKTLDITPPAISAIAVTNITPFSARVVWTTNENADSVVQYGPTVAYGSTQSNATLVLSHQIDLTALTPNVTYHFRVKSKDPSNNESVSADGTFLTPLPPPPVISNIRVTNITYTGARVLWDTDVAADTRLDYGLTAAYGSSGTGVAPATSHLVVLSGLNKGATYHYRVRSTDAYGQETLSTDQTFATLADSVAPANVLGFSATPGNAKVDLIWTNPTDADFTGVKIMRKTSGFPADASDGDLIYDGNGTSITDNSVSNGVLYYYSAFAHDDVPNYASGAVASATPMGPPDTTPPGDVAGFLASPDDHQVALTWTNPSDADFAGVRILRKTDSYPTGVGDGTIVYIGTGSTRVDAGLVNGTTYYYKIFAFDGVPNYSAGQQASATPFAPPDVTPPAPVTGLLATAGDSLVQLSWTNPADADWSGTRLVRKVGSQPTGPADGTVVFDAIGDNKLDAGLTNGTNYWYCAYAHDSVPNYASGACTSAIPLAALPPPPAPSCTDTDGGQVYNTAGTASDNSGSYTDLCTDAATLLENYCSSGFVTNESHACGNGFRCAAGRCEPDVFVPPTSSCGNNICEAAENNLNCAQDCAAAPVVPPIAPEPGQLITVSSLQFFAQAGRVRLRLSENGVLQTYGNMSLKVYLPDESIQKPIKTAVISFDGSSYMMRQTQSYEAEVTTPSGTTDYPMTVTVTYQDGKEERVSPVIRVMRRGQVFEMKDGARTPIAGARVSLYQDQGGGNFGLWSGVGYSQDNPQTTGGDGLFSYVLPTGFYRLSAEKENYFTKETLTFRVNQENVVSQDLQLISKPPPVVNKIQDILSTSAPAAEKAQDVAQAVTQTAVATAQVAAEQVREIIQSELVEESTRQIAVPVTTAVGVANVAAAGAATATAVPYILYLWSLLAHPTLLIARRRRRKWGVVYNALSKVPVDLAIVRLMDAKTNRLLRTAVTDKEGRYFFIVQPGSYKLAVVKPGHVFPTVFLKGQKEDIRLVDLYHGEIIEADKETAITANIPLDPVTDIKTPRRVLYEGIARRAQAALGYASILAMAVAVIITPSPVVVALLMVNIIMFIAFRRLAAGRKPKSWGIVYDEKTGRPVQNAVARIFESRFNKLLETQVTDIRGRYAFLVGSNVYYVTFEKPGYQKQQKGPVDLGKTEKEEEKVVAVDIRLTRASGEAGKPVPPKAEPPKTEPPKTPPPAPTPLVVPAPQPPAPVPPKPEPPKPEPPKPVPPTIAAGLEAATIAPPPATPAASAPPAKAESMPVAVAPVIIKPLIPTTPAPLATRHPPPATNESEPAIKVMPSPTNLATRLPSLIAMALGIKKAGKAGSTAPATKTPPHSSKTSSPTSAPSVPRPPNPFNKNNIDNMPKMIQDATHAHPETPQLPADCPAEPGRAANRPETEPPPLPRPEDEKK